MIQYPSNTLVLDVENSITEIDGVKYLDPFAPANTLTMVGMKWVGRGACEMPAFDHDEEKDTTGQNQKAVQKTLDETELLVCHNAQHDLMWIWESGFTYSGPIYDTMLGEYILLRGISLPLSLDGCATRRRLKNHKESTLHEYFDKGYNTNEIPIGELRTYLQADLLTTEELFLDQMADYAKPESASLVGVRNVTMETCICLTRIYCNGIAVDRTALDSVREEFETELAQIEEYLTKTVREVMGDTPINLNSPEQMSQVVFSRKLKNKKEWVPLFEHVRTPAEFKKTVVANTEIMYKTVAYMCPTCSGKGKVYKTKANGEPFAKPNRCKDCGANGYKLRNTSEIAGFKFSAPSKEWVSANGFSTSKDNLSTLIDTARMNKMDKAVAFLSAMQRQSAISSYLSTFVEGIAKYTREDGLLHVGLTQHITATGRFSGRNP